LAHDDPKEILKALNVAETGLAQAEAQKRLSQYGLNEIQTEASFFDKDIS
jgi:hypothetical protein